MPDTEKCPESCLTLTEGEEAHVGLSCEATGEVFVIFETRDRAVDFAESLMNDDGPWRIVFRRDRAWNPSVFWRLLPSSRSGSRGACSIGGRSSSYGSRASC